ncbi:protein kinase [Patescibacteria group bacterium]|nr:protein kinase [Patescibacteria group bacterium]MBP9709518.1 protein kinase [Patescibacteria group bacterium]
MGRSGGVRAILFSTELTKSVRLVGFIEERIKETRSSGEEDATVRDLSGRLAELRNPLPKSGDVIDGIMIQEEVGRGKGMVVFQATYRDEVVAFKILHPRFAGNSEACDMVDMEADVLRVARHACLPHFITAGTYRLLPYIVQSFAPGIDMFQFMDDHALGLSPRAIRCFIHLCDALDALHMNGVIHRDVKPANVLVAPSAPNNRVTLIDFNACQFVARGSGKKSAIGREVGTVDVMPPEVVRRLEAVPASDTYAVAALLRLLAYNDFLFGAPEHSRDEVVDRILRRSANPLPAESFDEEHGVPHGLRAVIQKGTAYEIKNRYLSARALAEALEPFAQ